MHDMESLERDIEEIMAAARQYGLDHRDMHFEICPPEVLYSFGAYGMPTRFGHWSFGKAYQRIKTEYDHNLSRMYEMVINTDPCYAFLLQGNTRIQNRLVIAHALAHSDFFKHNAYFARTAPRTVLESMAVAAGRIRNYEQAYGRERVEQFLDAALAVQEHVDYHHSPGTGRRYPAGESAGHSKNDVLGFIARFGHGLESWQRDILAVVREESLYFRPQLATKLCNEGWATFWHLKIMHRLELTEEETVDFARMHAQLVQPSRLRVNPYLLGLSIFSDIDRRWGRDAVFEARATCDDPGLLRNYLTEELVRKMDLFVFRRIGYEWRVVEKDWRTVRDTLIQNLFNCGRPYILVETGDFNGRGELYLKHYYEGVELDVHYLEKTLPLVHRLWGRPVHLETVLEEKEMLFSFPGDKVGKRLI
ncbi:MAG: SpoVR family protein [Bacillota bacterium]